MEALALDEKMKATHMIFVAPQNVMPITFFQRDISRFLILELYQKLKNIRAKLQT